MNSLSTQIRQTLGQVSHLRGTSRRLFDEYQKVDQTTKDTVSDFDACWAPLKKAKDDRGDRNVSGEGKTVRKEILEAADRLRTNQARLTQMGSTSDFVVPRFVAQYNAINALIPQAANNPEAAADLQKAAEWMGAATRDHQYAARFGGWAKGYLTMSDTKMNVVNNTLTAVETDNARGKSVAGEAGMVESNLQLAYRELKEGAVQTAEASKLSGITVGCLGEVESLMLSAIDKLEGQS
jgi:hypothetical protein